MSIVIGDFCFSDGWMGGWGGRVVLGKFVLFGGLFGKF
jgi:hypothetical protein